MATPTTDQEPILASWKINEVLGRYPQLLEVLVGMSPHFGRLRNPILRQVQGRLATVAQAAQIAGLDVAEMVRALNAAVGLAATEVAPAGETSVAPGTPPPPFDQAEVAVDLDVRPYQERGEEPFKPIMQAVAQVPEGKMLRLRNTFEPLPLYAVLNKRGFVQWARELGPNDWEILFYHGGTSGSRPAAPAPAPAEMESVPGVTAASWEHPTDTVTIDVSELVPPEPMVKILEALQKLPPEGTLLVHHARRPVYLYPTLDAQGYVHETRELESGQVELLIRKGPGAGGEQP